MSEPFLHVEPPAGPVRALALVLHGGRSRGTGAVTARQLAVLRMRPFVSSLQRAGTGRGLAVAHLRYRVRGWNGVQASPVPDTEWALDRLAERYPGVPAALVGHSMGGRAAVYAAGHPSVSTVVGLAPWIEPGDPVRPVAGRRVLFVHGDRDRMTSPPESAEFARQAAAVAASVNYVSVSGERHAMLRRARLWHDLATGFVLATLCDTPPNETVGRESANVLEKALTGNVSLQV